MTRPPFVAAFPVYQRVKRCPAFDALWTVLRRFAQYGAVRGQL